MKRRDILESAINCVCGKREEDYGTPENNFRTIAELWETYLNATHPTEALSFGAGWITSKDVCIMMALLKIARIATGRSADSFVDLAGYAACAAEVSIPQDDKMTCSNCRFSAGSDCIRYGLEKQPEFKWCSEFEM